MYLPRLIVQSWFSFGSLILGSYKTLEYSQFNWGSCLIHFRFIIDALSIYLRLILDRSPHFLPSTLLNISAQYQLLSILSSHSFTFYSLTWDSLIQLNFIKSFKQFSSFYRQVLDSLPSQLYLLLSFVSLALTLFSYYSIHELTMLKLYSLE